MRWPFSAARRKRKAASARPLPADMTRSYQPRIRRLEERRVLDVSAAFTSATGQLDILISNSADTATLSVANGQVVVTDSQNQAVPIDVDGGGPASVNASHVNRIDARGDAAAGQIFQLDSPLLLPTGLTVASSIERAELNGAITQVSGGDVLSDAVLTRLGADISTVDREIRLGGDVELLADVRLTGRNVELVGQLNDDGQAGTSGSLQIYAHGLTRLGGDVGSTAALSRLTTDAAGWTELGGDVQTARGEVEFADPVTLIRDVRISDMGGIGVRFGNTLDSRDGSFFGVRLETPSGRVAFVGDIGAGAMGDQRLGELIVEQAGDGVLFGDGGMSAVRVRGT
ncbi:MAG: hypothetical protein AB7O38_31315, partial [Pirellulaceae bacterium]